MNRLSATEVQNQRDFETILDAILSPNTTNEKIKEAEALLKELETRSLENLINCIIISLNAGSFPELGFASASRPEYRQLSATILYRILCKEKYDEARDTMYHHWERLSQPLCGRVLDGLINFISTENTANIMNQVFYATACLMRIIMKCHGQWPRLYELLNTFIPMPINGTPIVTMETAPNVLKGFKLYTNLVNEVMNDVGTQLGLICVKAAVFLGARPEDPRVCVDEETLNAIKDEAFATATGIMKYTLMKIRPENVSNSMAYAMISYIECLSVSIEKNGATPEREHHLLNVLGLMTDAAWFRSRELYNKVKILTNLTTSIIESERLSEGKTHLHIH